MYTEAEKQDLKNIGNNIRRLRTERGYSQEGFADAVSLHRTYMGGIERGERNLSALNLLKIIRKLDVHPNEIFSRGSDLEDFTLDGVSSGSCVGRPLNQRDS